eukprot:TRINITY_DN10975_c0_g3_i1.p1 TRINITY_DN10975_c0_g3~~TRINITY_DN10975_c0_g3_i1.p1  ORF type:complete len:165 (-),score=23.32 TRINITY_DN10975_c0_g3_i1:107-601(-)
MCIRDRSKQDYFPPLADHTPVMPWDNKHIPSAPIVRKSNLSKAEFYALVRKGQPFVVDDCADGWPYTKWSCADFGKAWPTGHMKAEYSPGQKRTALGDGLWWKNVRPGAKHEEHISQGKMVAGPYIWHVKDEEPIETKKSVQENWQSPYSVSYTHLTLPTKRIV